MAAAGKPKEQGAWEVLDFDSQILAVHATLLHTGDVLIFAGSGYRKGVKNYRTRVWHYPSAKFTAPRTPIDLFCRGHAALGAGAQDGVRALVPHADHAGRRANRRRVRPRARRRARAGRRGLHA